MESEITEGDEKISETTFIANWDFPLALNQEAWEMNNHKEVSLLSPNEMYMPTSILLMDLNFSKNPLRFLYIKGKP